MSISALRFGAVAPVSTLSTVQAAPVAAPVAQQPAATFTPRSLGLGDLVGGRASLLSAQEGKAPEPETPTTPEPEKPSEPEKPTEGGGKPETPPENVCRPGVIAC